MTEATKGICQRGVKVTMKDFCLFGSWFSPKNSEESTMDVGAEIIGTVKTNIKGSYKDTIENLTNNWPGGF